ncbi:MAG: phosphotransferase, partial [Turicibacter sp.]
MENIIKSVTAKALQVNQDDVKVAYRLMGGMSNFTFVIEVKGEKYTFRIPGKNAHVFVDRVEEAQNIEKIEGLGINNETVYLDTEAGYKIAKFVEGLSLGDCETPEVYLQDVADVLKTLHHSNLVAAKDYQPYERLASYEVLVNDLNHSHDPRYHALKEEFLSYREFLDQCPKVFCHNDSQ